MLIRAHCACCGKIGKFELTSEEGKLVEEYMKRGKEMGMLQELFPRVPAWIRSGAIDMVRTGGFTICPECGGM